MRDPQADRERRGGPGRGQGRHSGAMPDGWPPALAPGELTRDVRRLICDASDAGAEQRAIARHYGLTIGTVRGVLKRNGKLRSSVTIRLRFKAPA